MVGLFVIIQVYIYIAFESCLMAIMYKSICRNNLNKIYKILTDTCSQTNSWRSPCISPYPHKACHQHPLVDEFWQPYKKCYPTEMLHTAAIYAAYHKACTSGEIIEHEVDLKPQYGHDRSIMASLWVSHGIIGTMRYNKKPFNSRLASILNAGLPL